MLRLRLISKSLVNTSKKSFQLSNKESHPLDRSLISSKNKQSALLLNTCRTRKHSQVNHIIQRRSSSTIFAPTTSNLLSNNGTQFKLSSPKSNRSSVFDCNKNRRHNQYLITRNYVFLPATFSDLTQTLLKTFPSLRNIIDSSANYRTNLKLKLLQKQSSLPLPKLHPKAIQHFRTRLRMKYIVNQTKRRVRQTTRKVKKSTKARVHLLTHKQIKPMRSYLRSTYNQTNDNVKYIWKKLLLHNHEKNNQYFKKNVLPHIQTNGRLHRWWVDFHFRRRMNVKNSRNKFKYEWMKTMDEKKFIEMLRSEWKIRYKEFSNRSLSMLRNRKISYQGYYQKLFLDQKLFLESTKEMWKQKTVIIKEPTRNDWFDEYGYPLTSRHWLTNRFVNPWQSESSDGQHSLGKLWKWRMQRLYKQFNLIIGNKEDLSVNDKNLVSKNVDLMANKEPINNIFNPSNSDNIRMTWIGHSTCLVSMQGFTILTDPVFSDRASPLQIPGIGVERSVPPSISLTQLMKADTCQIDTVLISHDHYDHLDYESVIGLKESGKVRYWVVPLGIKEWLVHNCNINQDDIIEMKWWENAHFYKKHDILGDETVSSSIQFIRKDMSPSTFSNHAMNNATKGDLMTITCAPSAHWCSRTPFDRNSRLWCSFAVKTLPESSSKVLHDSFSSGLNFYFGGDTGLPPSFPLHRQIGDRLGPFDLAALPIGAYEPEFFMRDSHCNPEEAVKIHHDIRSKKSIGIHWGTFPLAEEGLSEPAIELQKAINKKRIEGNNEEISNFSVVDIGCSVESGK